jgi:hypothetical protein
MSLVEMGAMEKVRQLRLSPQHERLELFIADVARGFLVLDLVDPLENKGG